MDMATYLDEVERAAVGLFDLLGQEQQVLEDLQAKGRALIENASPETLKAHRDRAEARRRRLQNSALEVGGDPFRDVDDGVEAAKAGSAYAQMRALEEVINTHHLSRSGLAGAILQLAKQGISAVHGPQRDDAPPGDMVGSQHERNVIWEGRNQAQHWEEGSFNNPNVSHCFNQLKDDFGQQFANYDEEPKAPEVLDVLGWSSFQDLRATMMRLASEEN